VHGASRGQRDIPAALGSCSAALQRMQRAAQVSGDISQYRSDLANRHAYVADALLAAERAREALAHQHRRLDFIDQQLAEDPDNARLRARRIWALRGIANVEADLGQAARARERMEGAIERLEVLVRLDPDNADWRRQLGEMRVELARMR